MSPDDRNDDRKRHPIQVVARRTGLSADRLRAWEKRYGVVEPGRTDTDRRRYSDADVERLRLLHRAILGGRRIGQVAELSDRRLEELVREDEREEAEIAVELAGGEDEGPDPAPGYVRRALGAVAELDPRGLESVLERALVTQGATTLVEEVLAPLMEALGRRWSEGELTAAHEHLASAVVRRMVGDVVEAAGPLESAPGIVVATPAGQVHEFGALFAAATAAAQGWSTTYLGADLPADDIAAIARETRARAVALSIVNPGAEGDVDGELERLREALPADVTLLVGGRGAGAFADTLERVDAVRLDDLAELRRELVGLE